MKIKIKVDNEEHEVNIEEIENSKIKVKYDGEEHLVEINEERENRAEKKIEFSEKIIKAPMPGTINEIYVKKGDFVSYGDVMVSLIAMKMENKIIADGSGIIKEIKVNVNDNVEAEQILIVLE